MGLSTRDKKIIWHPYTQEKNAQPTIAVSYADGSYVYDEKGKSYLDLISSWWVNIHGHAHPKIAESIYKQALKLEHVIFAGFTHEPAVQLCESLQSFLPQSLNKFFFSDDGSTAVEIALKMTYQYWKNLGQPQRKLFLSFDGGYHGDTFGAMSVGNKSGFHDVFSDLFFNVINIPYPETWDGDIMVDEKETFALNQLNHYLVDFGQKIAAIILEPLIQGASGMRMVRPKFVEDVILMVRSYGILVIFDEVMTGFFRTGKMFALSHIKNVPDCICLSKGITGGFLPLALTISSSEIYNGFLADDKNKALLHGHSYTANPLACAAAITSLSLLTLDSCKEKISLINICHKKELNNLQSSFPKIVTNIRIIGTIAAFTIADSYYNEKMSLKFLEHGLLIRPLGKNVYLMPPYSISTQELKSAYKKIADIFVGL